VTKVILIAINHLRDQRWILITMFAYAIGMSIVMGAVSGRPTADDTRFFVEQQMWFSVLFSVFLATAAVNTDMRTRRMLAILSKAVERWQYLLGIVTSISIAIGAYCAMVALLGYMLSTRGGHPLHGVVALGAEVWVAALAVGCVGLFFGLILPPLLATTATLGFLTGVPLVGAKVGMWVVGLSPVTILLVQTIRKFHGVPQIRMSSAVLFTLGQGIVFFTLALFIFLRRDLSRPTE
jgi:hypothetical protein